MSELTPTRGRVLVQTRDLKKEEVTEAGIIIPEQVTAKMHDAFKTGTVLDFNVAAGDDFPDFDKGDIVYYRQHAEKSNRIGDDRILLRINEIEAYERA
jgi:co-chaperonin GroES (HSP10)